MTYPKACCRSCASGLAGLGDVNPALTFLTPAQKTAAYVLAFGAALGAVILLTKAPARRRHPSFIYDDPDDRTQRLPRESMQEVVEGRRR
jgi:hypothetical protein